MLEKDDVLFFDTSNLSETEGIENRATASYVQEALKKRFPKDVFVDVKVQKNETGFYQEKASLLERVFGAGEPIMGLPAYYEVELKHSTGEFYETLIVWSPVKWNDRFAGTAGGGTGIGGRNYLTRPNNTQRGWTVPFAVMNGFTAATMYAGNIEGWNDHTVDADGKLRPELYENWRLRSTHNMTVFGKAIAEILHNRTVKYSYMNGGSGGGRQSLVEVQNYPEDYDGVWASCPAINWHAFLMGGFWPEIVMKEHRHFLTAKKNQFFLDEVHRAYGGNESFYAMTEAANFDARDLIGRRVGCGKITEEDALVMNEIWAGPHRADGTRLWYGYRPGVQNWQKIIPIGTYYYPVFLRKVKPFVLGPLYLKWITEDKNTQYEKMTYEEYVRWFDLGMDKFADNMGDNPDLDAFATAGGKLMIDHGTDDPLIPVDGTLDYYQKLKARFGSQKALDAFLRLYITPGDNHGNCWGNGAGITEKAGMKALMDWVEKGIAPEEIRKVRVNRKSGEWISEDYQKPYRAED